MTIDEALSLAILYVKQNHNNDNGKPVFYIDKSRIEEDQDKWIIHFLRINPVIAPDPRVYIEKATGKITWWVAPR